MGTTAGRDSRPIRFTRVKTVSSGVGEESGATISEPLADGDGDYVDVSNHGKLDAVDGDRDASDGDDGIVDPESVGNRDTPDDGAPYGRLANGKPRKRRRNGSGSGGRRSGTGEERTASKKKSKDFVTMCLMGLHEMAAKVTHISQLEMSEEEAKELGDAITEVAELYDVSPQVSEKAMAWMTLGKVAVSVYGPRVASWNIDRQVSKRKPAQRPQPGNVINMGVGPAPDFTANAVGTM